MSDTVAAAAPLLAQHQLVELLGLVKDADSVELKLSVDAGLQRSAVEALGLDPLEAQVRLVHFFDTPDLALEVDAMTTGFVCSGSFKGVAQEAIRDSRARGAPLRKLFTKEQRAFYAEHAPEASGSTASSSSARSSCSR